MKFQDLYNMNTQKKVFEKLFSNGKVELASQKFEFALIDDIVKYNGAIANDFVRAQGLASAAVDNIEPILKNIILKSNDNLDKIANVKKMSSDLGIDVPKQIIDAETTAKNLIKGAQTGIGQISKVQF